LLNSLEEQNLYIRKGISIAQLMPNEIAYLTLNLIFNLPLARLTLLGGRRVFIAENVHIW
jgi:hypothetical protein